jgi:hypothetical protein
MNNYLLAGCFCLLLSGCASGPDRDQSSAADQYPDTFDAAPRHEQPPQPVAGSVAASRAGKTAAIRDFLPPSIHDREGWAMDIQRAFSALRLPSTPQNICAVVAITEQESSFHAEPVVAGLPVIVRREIEQRQKKYKVPQWLVDQGLAMTSPNGLSYRQRIDRLKTENDVNRLYDDMISELPLGQLLLSDYNPVRTGGPMQVSLAFATEQVKRRPYPYPYRGSLRSELFTRRGGLYFGIAYLLAYPVRYEDIVHRFADFNAGHYASRNAAFQQAIHALTGLDIDYDGDLLRYSGAEIAHEPGQTLKAVLTLGPRLGLSDQAIQDDLALEKSPDFGKSVLYAKTYELAQASLGRSLPREAMPEIRLTSPKISRHLTTGIFARRVNDRYRSCLRRARR